jgi:hypothetical protein
MKLTVFLDGRKTPISNDDISRLCSGSLSACGDLAIR